MPILVMIMPKTLIRIEGIFVLIFTSSICIFNLQIFHISVILNHILFKEMKGENAIILGICSLRIFFWDLKTQARFTTIISVSFIFVFVS